MKQFLGVQKKKRKKTTTEALGQILEVLLSWETKAVLFTLKRTFFKKSERLLTTNIF